MMIETKERMLEMNDCGEEYKLEQVRFILGSDFDRDLKDISFKGFNCTTLLQLKIFATKFGQCLSYGVLPRGLSGRSNFISGSRDLVRHSICGVRNRAGGGILGVDHRILGSH